MSQFSQTFINNVSFKNIFGKVHTATSNEWYDEHLTCSHKMSPALIMSQSIPDTPPTDYTTATTYNMIIHTGTFEAAVGPEGGRFYLVKDQADSTGRTWCVVHSGSWKASFNSTGSDRDLIYTNIVAPWHATCSFASSSAYLPTVYACTGSGNPPGSITEISASNVLNWVFYPEAGILKFENPTVEMEFTDFVNFEDNIYSSQVTNYTDNGYSILSDTRTTTNHIMTLGGTWLSGSTELPLSYLTGLSTGSCVAIDCWIYTGGYVNAVSQF